MTEFEFRQIKDWVLKGGESKTYPRSQYRYIEYKAVAIIDIIKQRISKKRSGIWIAVKK